MELLKISESLDTPLWIKVQVKKKTNLSSGIIFLSEKEESVYWEQEGRGG